LGELQNEKIYKRITRGELRMKLNTYNQKKLIGRQKFNACRLKAFEFGKNDQTEFDMKQIRDDLWEKI
jgi:hypothetical protein